MLVGTRLGLGSAITCIATMITAAAFAGSAKINDFQLIHPASTITSSSSYAMLSRLDDTALKQTVTSPQQGDYITVKKGTLSLRDGNTRVYLLRQRGYGSMTVTYDTVDTGFSFYDD